MGCNMFKTHKTNTKIDNKTQTNINWLLVKVEDNNLVKNLIIDEKLLAFMVTCNVPLASANKNLVGEHFGWHIGEDNNVYDVLVLNKQKLNNYVNNTFVSIKEKQNFAQQYNQNIMQLRKIKNHIADGSKEYSNCKTYFVKGKVKEFCEYSQSKEASVNNTHQTRVL